VFTIENLNYHDFEKQVSDHLLRTRLTLCSAICLFSRVFWCVDISLPVVCINLNVLFRNLISRFFNFNIFRVIYLIQQNRFELNSLSNQNCLFDYRIDHLIDRHFWDFEFDIGSVEGPIVRVQLIEPESLVYKCRHDHFAGFVDVVHNPFVHSSLSIPHEANSSSLQSQSHDCTLTRVLVCMPDRQIVELVRFSLVPAIDSVSILVPDPSLHLHSQSLHRSSHLLKPSSSALCC
jgi:hypothetical protein